MLRFWTVCLAIIVVPLAAAGGNELKPKCAESPDPPACWWELKHTPRCYFWSYGYDDGDIIKVWSGECVDGFAHGPGVVVSIWSGGYAVDKGELNRGKKQGRWVNRSSDGDIFENSYVDGKEHGLRVRHWGNGDVEETSYADGKRHGRWVKRHPNGVVREGSFVEGETEGVWTIRFPDGNRIEYENSGDPDNEDPGVYITKSGERHSGRWTGRCFRTDRDGIVRFWFGAKENCPD